MCFRITSTKPILPRNETETAIPPNWVAARCVWRSIDRSSDNRALISLGSGLSAALDCIVLLSQILDSKPRSNFGFQVSQSFATRADLFLRNAGPDANLNIADYADRRLSDPQTRVLQSSLPRCPCSLFHLR